MSIPYQYPTKAPFQLALWRLLLGVLLLYWFVPAFGQSTGSIAINAGGSAAGSFEADAYVSGGSPTKGTSNPIDVTGLTGAAPQSVYQTGRFGNFTYNFSPLTAGGTYKIRLHFAETYWTGPNQRKFHVDINSIRVLTDYDIVAAAGANNKAVIREFTVTASASGQISIAFINGIVDYALVNGIEIEPASGSFGINAGGNTAGIFEPDGYVSGGTVSSVSSNTIDVTGLTGAAPQSVYQSGRNGNFTYTFPFLSAGGTYKVRLHFAETYWTGPNQRKFHVDINSTRVLTDFDVFAAAGTNNKAVIREFTTTATTSGQISLAFVNGTADKAKINGIEIEPISTNTAPVLSSIGNKSVTIGQTLTFTAQATDVDVPAQTLSFGLLGSVPAGATINATTGQFSWPPTQAGSFTFTVKVNDNGIPALSAQQDITVTVNSNEPPTDGLKAYYPFSSSNTMGQDASGNGYTGTLYNTPSWVAGGRIGGSLEAVDNQGRYMNVPGLNWQPTQFTVAWWHYPESYADYNQVIYSAIGWGGFAFHTTANGSVYVGTDVNTRLTPTELPAGTVKLYQWQHFTFTYVNGTGKFYKNGQLLATKTGMALPVAWGGFNIGSNGPISAIHGMVDEMRIYDRALTDAEITRTANFFTAGTCTWQPVGNTHNWNSPSNWSTGRVPTSNDNVVVNACTVDNSPQLPSNVRLNNLTLNTGAKLDLQAFTLNISNAAYIYYATINSTGGMLRARTFSQMYRSVFNGAIVLEKSGGIAEGHAGGNTFNGVTTFNYYVRDPEYSFLRCAMYEGDIFNEDLTINSWSGTGIHHATSYYGGTTSYKKRLTGNATGSGLAFGKAVYEGPVTLNANGRTIGVSKGNFSGTLTLNLQFANYYGGNFIAIENSTFAGPVLVSNTNTGLVQYGFYGIRIGNSTDPCIFTPTSSLSVSTGNFYRGDLLLERCTFQYTSLTQLDLSSGPASSNRLGRLIVGAGTYFTGPVEIKAPNIQLNGGTFGGEATFIKTGSGADNSVGGNTFRRKATFTNQAGASSPLNLATQVDDIVQQ